MRAQRLLGALAALATPATLATLAGCTESPADTAGTHLDTDTDTGGCGHEPAITWSSGGESFFANNCWTCHSSTAPDRYGAPDYLNYDTYAGVEEAAHSIRQAALWDQVMPPGYPLEADDRWILESFLDCGL